MFKMNDVVSYGGLEGRVYTVGDDWFGVEFLNVAPESEYKHKYLEFFENGKTHIWLEEPQVKLIEKL